MLQAESDNTRIPSRRDVIRGAGKVAGAAVLAPAVAATSPQIADSHLLRLCAEMDALRAREKVLLDRYMLTETPEAEAALDEASDEVSAVVTQIEQTPASTIDGLRVKARALSWCWCGDEPDNDLFYGPTTDSRLMRSIWTDLTGWRG